jgi:hypothetical protein
MTTERTELLQRLTSYVPVLFAFKEDDELPELRAHVWSHMSQVEIREVLGAARFLDKLSGYPSRPFVSRMSIEEFVPERDLYGAHMAAGRIVDELMECLGPRAPPTRCPIRNTKRGLRNRLLPEK